MAHNKNVNTGQTTTISKRAYNKLVKDVRKEIDDLYKETFDQFKMDIQNKADKKYVEYVDDVSEDIYGKIDSWIGKNYWDLMRNNGRKSYYYYLANPNVDFSTSDTGMSVHSIKFFEQMTQKDTHIYATVWSLIDGVTALEWEIVPYNSSIKESANMADFIDDIFRNKIPDFAENIETLARSIITGFSIQEKMFGFLDGYIIPYKIEYRDPADFLYDDFGRLFFVYSNKKKEVSKEKFLIHSYKGNFLNPYGESILGERVFWMYYFKRIVWRFRLRFLERFGNPLMIHQYQTDEERIKIKEALIYMASKGAIQVPMGSKINPVEVARGTEDFQNAINDLNREISKCIVGQTATLEREGGGSYASDYIRQDMYYTKLESLLKSIESTLNDFIRQIIRLNFTTEVNFPKFKFKNARENLRLKESERDLSWIREGAPLKIKDILQKYGLPIPEDLDPNATFHSYPTQNGDIKGGIPINEVEETTQVLDKDQKQDKLDSQTERRRRENVVKDKKRGKPVEGKGTPGGKYYDGGKSIR